MPINEWGVGIWLQGTPDLSVWEKKAQEVS